MAKVSMRDVIEQVRDDFGPGFVPFEDLVPVNLDPAEPSNDELLALERAERLL